MVNKGGDDLGTVVKSINETYKVRGEDINISTKARFDTESGKQVFDENLDNAAITAAFDKYRAKHNIISPVRIKKIRQSLGLSQRDFAALLNWSPTTIATYETGSLPVEANSLLLLALEKDPELAVKLYDNSKDTMTQHGRSTFEKKAKLGNKEQARMYIEKGINEEFSDTNFSEFSGFNAFDLKKFSNVVLYFVNEIPKVTKTKLNKLLFYTDFKYFAKSTISITGVTYARLKFGPVPNDYELLYGAMTNSKLLSIGEEISNGYEVHYYVAEKPFDESLFNEGELQVMADSVRRLAKYSAGQISELSHREKAWIENDNSELISYLFAEDLSTLE